jgi:pimeloyl-ACP methyl ester carboxylesterase
MKAFLRFLTLLALGFVPASAASLAWQDLAYTTRDSAKVKIAAQAARRLVPEDPARPDGAQVELALFRLRATTATPGAPIVYLHGGPGGASLEHLDSPDFRAVFAVLQARADVILLDQRGCGKSTPTLVPPRTPPAPDLLATRETFLGHLVASSTLVRDQLRKTGHDPRHFTVLDSVDDLESLRRALDVPRLDLFAHSYGTQLAQAFARAHPSSVGRMVLVGSRGMDTARKLPAETDAFLERVAALARADATVGAGFPDLLATLDRVLAKLDRAPVAVEMENQQKEKFSVAVGGYALRFIIAKFYLHDPDNTKYLPKLLDELDTGRRPWSLVFNLNQILASPVSFAWFTTDAASGVSPARAETIRTQAATTRLGDAMNFPFPDINAVWDMPDLGDAFRAPVETDIPTLFVAATLDGITPVAQTREIMRGFSRARLLVVENGGHNSQLRPPEVAAAIAAFYADRPTPEAAAMPPPTFMPLIAEKK